MKKNDIIIIGSGLGGLECGILAGKLEGLDCISTGPDLENVHTVRERMKISSVENVWTFVLALLKEAAL